MKKFLKKTNKIIRKIISFIDDKVILPVTKFIISITSRFDLSGKYFENFLSRTNTILYISLILSVLVFVVVDQKIIVFTDSSAEVLRGQSVTAVYNEEAYVIEGLPSTVDVTLIGTKADLYFAKQSPSNDITVDLSDLKAGTHKVNITYNQVLPSIDYKVNPSVATVIIYPKVSSVKTLTVDILNQEALNDKMVIKSVVVANDSVIIKGAEYKLEKVATVKALVDINNIVKQQVGVSNLKDIPLKAYDELGNVVDVEIVPSKIAADITIASPSKDVPIKVIPTGDLSFGKAISSININATSVTVYGDEEALSNLSYIPVEIDVNGLKDARQYKLELVRPVGVKSMSVNNVTINVTVDESIDKEIANVGIVWRNIDETKYRPFGLGAEDTQVSVILKGAASVVNQIKASDIIAYVDLNGLGVGTHEVEVFVEGSDLKVQYVPKTKKVTIRITAK